MFHKGQNVAMWKGLASQKHTKLRLVSHSIKSLCFWEVSVKYQSLIYFHFQKACGKFRKPSLKCHCLSNRPICWSLAFPASPFHFKQLAGPDEKHLWRFQEPRRARCSVDIIYISQVQMFPWFLSTTSQVTHIKWLLVLPASQENEEMTLGPLDLWWVQINHTIK